MFNTQFNILTTLISCNDLFLTGEAGGENLQQAKKATTTFLSNNDHTSICHILPIFKRDFFEMLLILNY